MVFLKEKQIRDESAMDFFDDGLMLIPIPISAIPVTRPIPPRVDVKDEEDSEVASPNDVAPNDVEDEDDCSVETFCPILAVPSLVRSTSRLLLTPQPRPG